MSRAWTMHRYHASVGSLGARPRSSRMMSSVLTPGGSLKRPRAREMASSTSLRRMMRPPSSSTFKVVPLLSPRAVSYTHLDVYKRQILLAAVRSAVLWRQLGGSYWDFLLSRKAMLEAVEAWLR